MAKRYKNYIDDEIKEQSIKKEPKPELKPEPLPKVRVTAPNLRKRLAPSEKGQVIGYITDHGTFQLKEIKDGWGRLEDGAWIMLSFTEKI